MSSFEEKTPFDVLKDQNQKLANELEFANNCLNVLIEFKNIFNRIIETKSYSKLFYLKTEDIRQLRELNKKHDKVLADKQIKSKVNEENKELFVSQNIDSLNSFNRSTNQSLNFKPLVVIKRLSLNRSTKQSLISKPQKIIVQNNGSDIIQATANPSNTELVVKCIKSSTRSSIGSLNPINELPISRVKTIISNIEGVDHDTNNTTKDVPTDCGLQRQLETNSFENTIERLKPNFSCCDVVLKCIVNNCNKTYESLPFLADHQKESHQIERPIYDNNYKRWHICDYPECGKGFDTAWVLARHRRSFHSSVIKCNCDFPGCGKTFKGPKHLANHLKIHSDPYFHCSYNDCNYRTKTKGCLKAHEIIHSNKKPFKCEYNDCGARFRWRTSLTVHSNTHKNESSKVCPIKGCGKLIKPFYLKNHIKEHSMEYLLCDYPGCHYKCKLKAYMKEHKQNVHTTERNFVCYWPECGKASKTNSDLSKHMKRHTNDRRYACDWPQCEFRTYSSQPLKEHLRTHTKEKPYACDWPGCDYRCAIDRSLKSHWKLIHKKLNNF